MDKTNSAAPIYETLKDEITFLIIPPNQRISEIEVAKRFNVSRTPIRDVFKRLEVEGFLKIIPQKGTYVTRIDMSDLADMMYLREKIELAVVEDLCGKLSQDQIIRLQFQIAQQKKLLSESMDMMTKARNFIKHDNVFHSTIFSQAGKPSLWKYMLNIGPHYHRYRTLNNLKDDTVLTNLCEEHEKIVEALIHSDMQTIKQIYQEHIFGGLSNFYAIVNKYPQYFTKTDMS